MSEGFQESRQTLSRIDHSYCGDEQITLLEAQVLSKAGCSTCLCRVSIKVDAVIKDAHSIAKWEVSSEDRSCRLRDGEKPGPPGQKGYETYNAADGMPGQIIVNMPDNRSCATNCSDGGDNAGANGICVDCVRRDISHSLPKGPNESDERGEMADKSARMHGKSGMQRFSNNGGYPRSVHECHKITVVRTNDNGIKLASVQASKRIQKNSLGPTRESGVIVEKNSNSIAQNPMFHLSACGSLWR